MAHFDTKHVAGVPCDYIDWDGFTALATQWLTSSTFHHVVTLNPEMVIAAQTNKEFSTAINEADLRTPDGSGLIWARWYLRSRYWNLLPSLTAFTKKPAQRITGIDTMEQLCALAEQHGYSVYLLGGTPTQLTRTAAHLTQKYPRLTVHQGSAGICDYTGPAATLEDIKQKKPAVLFVAYGAPKQTVWIEKNRSHLRTVRIAVGVGGAFSILSEHTPRAPRWLRRHNLEWLWRLYLEPSRLPRIWRATVQFPLLVRKQRKTRD